jgi:3-deoxy-D-manno-octulosonate 8-phosphate phosphatase KdsC-like HAD superfamily phosphatase
MLDPVRSRRIRLFGTDVDGCLTDNGLYIGEVAGVRVEFKRFDVLDGLAIIAPLS